MLTVKARFSPCVSIGVNGRISDPPFPWHSYTSHCAASVGCHVLSFTFDLPFKIFKTGSSTIFYGVFASHTAEEECL